MKTLLTLFTLFTLSTILLLITACSPKPYSTTNKAYRKQVKEFTKTILQEPVDPLNDTIKLPPYWIGTTNFGIRKPNFVIIHHTAQNSCPPRAIEAHRSKPSAFTQTP